MLVRCRRAGTSGGAGGAGCGRGVPGSVGSGPCTLGVLHGCVCGSDWVGCTGRGEARGSRELCACAGRRMLMLMLMFPRSAA